MEKTFEIRAAKTSDGVRLAEIYEPYVCQTVITFEEEAPSAQEMAHRVVETQKDFPWLVYEENEKVLGYAYAHQMQARAAFQWSAEVSVYLDWNYRGHGAGHALYAQLEKLLKEMGVAQLYAQIAVPNPESIGFHHACGYEDLCLYPHIGYKRNKWCDLAVLVKQLQLPEHPHPRKKI